MNGAGWPPSTEAAEAPLRHGRWTCVLFIVGCVVLLIRVVPNSEVVSEGSTQAELLATVRPWTTFVVVAWDLWAGVLLVLLVRYRDILPTSKSARSGFIRASLVMMVASILPGLFIWGWYGLPAAAICLGCFLATMWFKWVGRHAASPTDARSSR